MVDIYKIDVTGDDTLKKGFGIVVLYNRNHAYGYRFSSPLQFAINRNKLSYGCSTKLLKPRVYCATLTLIFRQIHREHPCETKNFELHLCNDYDGHQGDIIQILRELTVHQERIFEELTVNQYAWMKHPKKSTIQEAALAMYRGDWTRLTKVKIDENELHNLIAKRKHRRKRW